MSDLISRADAISVLDNFTQTDTLGHTPRQIVEALPSAQPEQRWIPFKTRPLTKEEKEEHPEWDVRSHEPIKCGKEPVPKIEKIDE